MGKKRGKAGSRRPSDATSPSNGMNRREVLRAGTGVAALGALPEVGVNDGSFLPQTLTQT